MSLDSILAGTDTVMTPELIRLFKVAGCSPTACHVCAMPIKAGDTFKLVSYNRNDEMCCELHGKPDLVKRNRERKRDIGTAFRGHYSFRHDTAGGYSRPSKRVGPKKEQP